MRKNRKVSRVMGWLLSLQVSEPGAGVCCAVSMLESLRWRVPGRRLLAVDVAGG
jgi:hypothetical protein